MAPDTEVPVGREGGSLSGPEAVADDDVEATAESESAESADRRPRRWYGLLAVILLLLLLLCFGITVADLVITRGPQQARFIARNLECLQCHTELIPDFSRAVVHQPFALEECTVCHTPHGKEVTSIVTRSPGRTVQRLRTWLQWLPLRLVTSTPWAGSAGGSETKVTVTPGDTVVSTSVSGVPREASTLVLPADKLCWTCHGSMGALLGEAYQHKPFTAGQCGSCHSPHASDTKALLTQAPDKLCFTCHPMGAQINRKQGHPPAKRGWCIDCHNPHASANRGVLVARQRDLCFRCHPSVGVLSGLPVQHQPFLEDNCTGCHEPHGSDETPLLVRGQPALCFKCHPAIRNQFAKASHHPVGVELTCGSCHNPHAAQYASLIDAQDNSFCYQCHGDKLVAYSDSAHYSMLCVKCHTPHGSQFEPILTARNPDLCLRCHSAMDDEGTHPVRTHFFDLHAKKGLTCSSSCHNPHGTDYQYMLKNFNSPQDGQCLQCHKYTGVYY